MFIQLIVCYVGHRECSNLFNNLAVTLIEGGNQSTRRKQPTNFIT